MTTLEIIANIVTGLYAAYWVHAIIAFLKWRKEYNAQTPVQV